MQSHPLRLKLAEQRFQGAARLFVADAIPKALVASLDSIDFDTSIAHKIAPPFLRGSTTRYL